MSLITVFIVLIVVGFFLWLVNNLIPMARSIKSLLNIVVVILLIVWLLKVFGLWIPLTNSLKSANINLNTHSLQIPAQQNTTHTSSATPTT